MSDIMTNLVNLTPHDVVIYDDAPIHEDRTLSEVLRIPPSGQVLRLRTEEQDRPRPGWVEFDDVTIETPWVEFHRLDDQPPPRDGTMYIVSLPCALSSARSDFLVPYDEVREPGTGRILGCRRLARPM